VSAEKTILSEILQRVNSIQTVTLVWMSIETIVSLGAALLARSPALVAFGGDSAVELLSAAIVLRHFYSTSRREDGEGRASKARGTQRLTKG
jgi:hypothetical protein